MRKQTAAAAACLVVKEKKKNNNIKRNKDRKGGGVDIILDVEVRVDINKSVVNEETMSSLSMSKQTKLFPQNPLPRVSSTPSPSPSPYPPAPKTLFLSCRWQSMVKVKERKKIIYKNKFELRTMFLQLLYVTMNGGERE